VIVGVPVKVRAMEGTFIGLYGDFGSVRVVSVDPSGLKNLSRVAVPGQLLRFVINTPLEVVFV
jgi:hypothetical protein